MEAVHSLVLIRMGILCDEGLMMNSFSTSVELESLGPLLGQIVVALYPVIDVWPYQVGEIFNFLIVENRSVT